MNKEIIRNDLANMVKGSGFKDYGKCQVFFGVDGNFHIYLDYKQHRYSTPSLKNAISEVYIYTKSRN